MGVKAPLITLSGADAGTDADADADADAGTGAAADADANKAASPTTTATKTRAIVSFTTLGPPPRRARGRCLTGRQADATGR